MQSLATKKFITFVGDPLVSHPSFLQAREAGLIASWVRNARELIVDLTRTPFTNLIIFDSRHRSPLQCELCQQLTSQGYRIICIGAAGEACAPFSILETDLLSAILASVVFDGRGRAPDSPPAQTVTIECRP